MPTLGSTILSAPGISKWCRGMDWEHGDQRLQRLTKDGSTKVVLPFAGSRKWLYYNYLRRTLPKTA
jgi:hypothetical protein